MRRSSREWLAPAALTAVAAAMRFFRLSEWSLAANEPFTLRDSLSGSWNSMKPLLFQINHHVVAPLVELDEFGLRLVPALAGVLAIPAVYVCGRELFDRRAGVIAALLVTFNPWHLYWSQTARYYSLVFLFATLFVAAFYLGFSRKDGRWLIVALVAAVLGILSHASVGLLVAGACAWLVAWMALGRTRHSAVSPSPFAVRVAVIALVAFAAACVLFLLPTLKQWAARTEGWGFAGFTLVASYTNWLSAGVTLAGLAGLSLCFLRGRKALGWYLVLALGVPAVALSLLGYLVSVSVAYLYSTTPVLVVTAGAFVAYVIDLAETRSHRLVVATALVLVLLATGAPTLVSHYRDGTRPDYRGAADFLLDRTADADRILVDEAAPYRYYMGDRELAGFFRNPARLDSLSSAAARAGGDVWIAAWHRRRGGFDDKDLGRARSWVERMCRREAAFGTSRLDHRLNVIQVFHCPGDGHASGEPAAASSSDAAVSRRVGSQTGSLSLRSAFAHAARPAATPTTR